MSAPFYGKYRGVVTDNQDPLFIGRVRAKVPDVLGETESGWAMACTPFAGNGSGFFAIPDVGVGVWIEFEHGDPEYPIWTGCWWGFLSDVPSEVLVPPFKKTIIKTVGGHSILLDDTPAIGGITLQTSGGQKIALTASGIDIDNGLGATISLKGLIISLNNGALDVLK
jgi:hypothetical protein